MSLKIKTKHKKPDTSKYTEVTYKAKYIGYEVGHSSRLVEGTLTLEQVKHVLYYKYLPKENQIEDITILGIKYITHIDYTA